jgi:hypothetical protein
MEAVATELRVSAPPPLITRIDHSQRRRDRGKRAQREFRRRQAAKASDLRERHDRLEAILQDIVRAHDQHGHTAIDQAVAEARRLLPNGFEKDSQDHSTCIQEHETPVASTLSAPRAQDVDSDCGNLVGRFSPRLDYTFLFRDPQQLYKVPPDIAPYIGPGRYTIAGHIMWACLEYAWDTMREASLTQSNANFLIARLPSSSRARQLCESAFRHSEHFQDVAFMLALVEARLEFRSFSFTSDTPGADENLRRNLENSVKKDLLFRGVVSTEWWTALEIQGYICARIGMLRFSNFQSSLQRKDATHVQILATLAQRLAPRAVCFGDGPRWNMHHTAVLVDTWAQTICEITDLSAI